jgi:hypothetical protein
VKITGIAYRAESSPRLSARGWILPTALGPAVLNFNPTHPVGPVSVMISTEGTVTATIDAGPAPRTPEDFRRWGLYAAHPTLAVGFADNPDQQGSVTLMTVSLVRDNLDPDTPPWTVED